MVFNYTNTFNVFYEFIPLVVVLISLKTNAKVMLLTVADAHFPLLKTLSYFVFTFLPSSSNNTMVYFYFIILCII